ncbi:MAG: hypothetical protein ABSD96_01785, partial [Candidatus Korobacteraceae bacterium]
AICLFLNQLQASSATTEDLLLSGFPGNGGTSILANRLPDTFCSLTPFNVVGTFGMPFLITVNENKIRFNTAIGGYNGGVVTESSGGFHPFGEFYGGIHADTLDAGKPV